MKRWFFFYFITLFSTINGSGLVIFNVGQGNCNFFIPDQTLSGSGGTGIPVLYDAGSWGGRPSDANDVKIDKSVTITEIVSKIKASLQDDETSLNVVLSHGDSDHHNYVLAILSQLPKELIFNFYFGGKRSLYPDDLIKKLEKYPLASAPIFFFADTPTKSDPTIGNPYTCEALSWLDSTDLNTSSLVLKISRSDNPVNSFSIILAGDATGETTQNIDSQNTKDTTLLVANHHGAGTHGSNNESWITGSAPKIIVFSASKSKNGHPDKEVIRRYLDSASIMSWPIHEFSYSGDLPLDVKPHFVTYNPTEAEKQKDRSYFRAINRKALLNTMNEGTLRFKFTSSTPTLMQPQTYFGMFPLRHITKFALVDAEITNDEFLQIAPKMHLLDLLTFVDFSKNKLRIKDADDNEMVAATEALLSAIISVNTMILVGNDIDGSHVKTTMKSDLQFKKLIITSAK